MSREWSDLLAEVARGVDTAMQVEDYWYLVTALGLDEHSLQEAEASATAVAAYAGGRLDGLRVLDLGCGVGRHVRAFMAAGAQVTGVDGSPALVKIARRLEPGAEFHAMDYSEIGRLGGFGLVVSFAHSMALESGDRFGRNLRLARGVLRDGGLLVLEVQEPPTSDEARRWDGPAGLSAREVCTAVETIDGLRTFERRFEFRGGQRCLTLRERSIHPTSADLAALAEEAGFRLEGSCVPEPPVDATLFFLRAEREFNYLSDLEAFVAAWRDPSHERNLGAAEIVTTPDGRRRPAPPVNIGQGVSLGPYQPGFLDSIEPDVRPLVEVLAFEWSQMTYSSCEGHYLAGPAGASYTQAYCGVVCRSDQHADDVSHLLEHSVAGVADSAVIAVVRRRRLYGERGSLPAVDLHFERAQPQTPWAAYRQALPRAVHAVVQSLREVRARVGGPDVDQAH